MLKEDLHNISINDLFNSGKISARAYTCCGNAQFKSLFDIVSYYHLGNSFLNIRNAGRRTYEELESLCKDIILQITNFSTYQSNTTEEPTEKQEKVTFSLTQKVFIEKKYSELLNSCSVRTYNGLRKFSAGEFIKYYLNCQSNELLDIKNIGRKSVNEIIEFRAKFKAFIEEIKNIEDSPLQSVRLETKNKYGNLCANDFVTDFFEKSSHLPMLWILEQHIITSKNRGVKILINSFKIFNNRQVLTLETLAAQYSITRERVRQIRNDIFHKTFEITDEIIECKNKSDLIKYGQLLQNKDDWAYLLDTFKEIDIICQESLELQNHLKEEKCNFSIEFILQIIAYIFRDKYILLGGIDISNRVRIWDNTFLIKKGYSNVFDFEKMREEFSNILLNNETDYLLDIENYIANSQCWIKYDFDKTNSITNIVRDILLYEFHLYSEDIEGLIKIPANKERNTSDVVLAILQHNGKPMHIDDIFVEFKKVLPEHKYTESYQIRPYLQRHEAITIINRKSVYTLKEWEHIKTGTIRDAIVEILNLKDTPQSLENVTKYVIQFFPTTPKNIHSTMLSGRKFIQYKNNLFGLVNKQYPLEYEETEQQEGQRKSFAQRLFDLEKFIIENDHFPFSSSEDKNEESLYRWWRLIINDIANINNEQRAEVERVKLQYSSYETDKKTYEWNLNYNKFKCFLLENRRIPSATREERYLYGWLRRAREDFQNYRLSEEQRRKYIELAKLI